MSSKFVVGDKVVLTEQYSEYPEGTVGTVTATHPGTAEGDLVSVKPDTGGREFSAFEFRLKTDAPTDFKIGDRVKIVPADNPDKYYFTEGYGTVTEKQGVSYRVLQDTASAPRGTGHSGKGWWLGAESLRPIEKPKATLVTETDKPAIGDTVVAYWDHNGVEYRQKGVVANIHNDGTLVTKEGNFINFGRKSASGPESFAEHVYIVTRAPKAPEPKVLAHQKYIDAPIGSIAISPSYKFQWSKTAENEWTFFSTDTTHTFRDRTDENVGQNEDTLLITF